MSYRSVKAHRVVALPRRYSRRIYDLGDCQVITRWRNKLRMSASEFTDLKVPRDFARCANSGPRVHRAWTQNRHADGDVVAGCQNMVVGKNVECVRASSSYECAHRASVV